MLRDKDDTRTDDTGFGGIKVIQRRDFGYGVDSVLLAAFAAGETGAKPLRRGVRVADLGSGSGIVSFIIAHKVPDTEITGIEKQADACARSLEACRINGLGSRVTFVNSDVLGIEGRHDFDAVVSNPPYFRRGKDTSEAGDRYVARHETTADIGDFVRTASSMLVRGGSLYMVHRPDRLTDIITEMRNAGVEPKEMQMVTPAPGRAANIVLVHGIKDAGPQLTVLPEIAVHTSDGGYTDLILRIYERSTDKHTE